MDNTNIFARATRLKLTFDTDGGTYGVEDLWDLKLTSDNPKAVTLDRLALEYDRQLTTTPVKSFVNNTPAQASEITRLKFDVVKYILDTKLAEQRLRREADALKAEEQRLLEILDRKDNEALNNMTREQVKERLDKVRADREAAAAQG